MADDKRAPAAPPVGLHSNALSQTPSDNDYSQIEEAFQQVLDTSLNPRGPDSLFEVVGSLGLPADGVAVDIGCGDGRDSLELARRFGLRLLGVDPLPGNIERASAEAMAAGLDASVKFQLGRAEALPLPNSSVDLVWCKEALMFAELQAAFTEFRRVLRPNGMGFVYQVLTGPHMSDAEAREFWSVDMGWGPAQSQRPADIEGAIVSAGLELRQRIDVGSEWGEYAQEHTGAGGRRLLHTARLLRDPRRYIDTFGQANYRIMLGDCLWHVYRMIGKLLGAAFIFTRPQ